jgi:hypothetical protein
MSIPNAMIIIQIRQKVGHNEIMGTGVSYYYSTGEVSKKDIYIYIYCDMRA